MIAEYLHEENAAEALLQSKRNMLGKYMQSFSNVTGEQIRQEYLGDTKSHATPEAAQEAFEKDQLARSDGYIYNFDKIARAKAKMGNKFSGLSDVNTIRSNIDAIENFQGKILTAIKSEEPLTLKNAREELEAERTKIAKEGRSFFDKIRGINPKVEGVQAWEANNYLAQKAGLEGKLTADSTVQEMNSQTKLAHKKIETMQMKKAHSLSGEAMMNIAQQSNGTTQDVLERMNKVNINELKDLEKQGLASARSVERAGGKVAGSVSGKGFLRQHWKGVGAAIGALATIGVAHAMFSGGQQSNAQLYNPNGGYQYS